MTHTQLSLYRFTYMVAIVAQSVATDGDIAYLGTDKYQYNVIICWHTEGSKLASYMYTESDVYSCIIVGQQDDF